MLTFIRKYCTQTVHVFYHKSKNRVADLCNTSVTPIRESWIYNFNSLDQIRLGIIQLHPRIFSTFPRVDCIRENLDWQTTYRKVDWTSLKTSAEFRDGNKKPWPQKGTGRARHSSIRSPQWIYGGWCHGPRGPKTGYYMLDFEKRVAGLTSMLAVKFAQNDLKIIDSLVNFPSDEPEFLEQLMEKRVWGPTALIIDKSDIFPRNIALAAQQIQHINLMPVYGLNVLSMLKHETLILTVAALQELQDKIIFHLSRIDLRKAKEEYKPAKVVPDYPNMDPEVQP